MKKRLLKFACPGCGARLAVPPEMAGLSDQCPKCGTVVTAPLSDAGGSVVPVATAPPVVRPTPAPAPTPAPGAQAPVTAPPAAVPAKPITPPATTREMDAWSSDALADALNPPAARPAPRQEARSQRDVQPEFLHTAPNVAPLEPAPAPRKPAHEVLDSILRKKEPVTNVAVPRPSQPAPSPFPAAPPADPVPRVPAAAPAAAPSTHYEEPPPSALVPQHLSDSAEVERASMLGMGEVLAGAGQGNSGNGTETRPFLHVPFVPVRSSPDEERQARRGQLRTMGIICFLLIDVLAIFIWKDEITAWINRMTVKEQPRHVSERNSGPGTQRPSSSHEPQPDPAAATAENGTDVPMAQPQGGNSEAPPNGASKGPPLGPLPTGTLQPSTPASGLTIASPADFSGNMPTGAPPSGGVPMAIPIPGHSTDNVPTATPVTTPPATEKMDGKATPSTEAVVPPPAPPTAMAPAPAAPPPVPTEASVPVPPPIALSGTGASALDMTLPSTTDAPTLSMTPSATTGTGSRRVVGRVTSEAKSALDALLKFLDASTWKERLNYVQKTADMPAALEKYTAANGDGPIAVDQIEFLERYPSKAGVPPYCMFEVSGGGLRHPVLVLVEQSPKNGVRIDWQAFIEFKDDLLLRFLENKNSPPEKFRVMIRRKHYFDRDVPDIASKDSFQLEQPNSDFQGHVFVARNSALGKQLASQLPWSQDMPVIAELVWKSDAKSWWVEISKIVSYGWRS